MSKPDLCGNIHIWYLLLVCFTSGIHVPTSSAKLTPDIPGAEATSPYYEASSRSGAAACRVSQAGPSLRAVVQGSPQIKLPPTPPPPANPPLRGHFPSQTRSVSGSTSFEHNRPLTPPSPVYGSSQAIQLPSRLFAPRLTQCYCHYYG